MTEGGEVHESTDEARAGSTPNIVRWVLAISLLAVIVLLSLVWITGAVSTDEADRTATVTDRMQNADEGDGTDSIVSDDPVFQMAPDQPTNPMNEAAPQEPAGPTAPADPAPSPSPQ